MPPLKCLLYIFKSSTFLLFQYTYFLINILVLKVNNFNFMNIINLSENIKFYCFHAYLVFISEWNSSEKTLWFQKHLDDIGCLHLGNCTRKRGVLHVQKTQRGSKSQEPLSSRYEIASEMACAIQNLHLSFAQSKLGNSMQNNGW